MSYLVLARKWRPQKFDELVGQEPIARMLSNVLSQNKVAHAYIFSGPRGVGKTSTARILAKSLNCERGPAPEPCGACPSCVAIADGSSVDVTEIDGASNTGVDNVRDLRERIRYASSGGKYKIYIIDEAHMLSTAAFNALLKTLEEPPSHVIFVLATTDPKKIPATVMSRCQHLPFRRISTQRIKTCLRQICDHEGIAVSDAALELIARAADGSIRDALTITDQVTSFSDDVRVEDIRDLIGISDLAPLAGITASIIRGDRKRIILIIGGLADAGTDLRSFSRELLLFMRNVMIAKVVDSGEVPADLSEEESTVLHELKDMTSEEHIALLLSEFIKAEPAIRNSLHPRTSLETTLIRLSMLSHFTSIDRTLRHLKGLPPQDGAPAGGEIPSSSLRPMHDSHVKPADSKARGGASAKPPHADPSSPAHALSETWEECLSRLAEMNPPLSSKLREGHAKFTSDGITVVFNGGLSVHAESVRHHIAAIRSVLSDISGRQISLKIETAKGKTLASKDLKEKMLQDPVVKEALELFEGRIVDIIPMKHAGGEDVKKDAR